MEIIFRHLWLMFIAVIIVNGLILKHRSKKYIAQNPELEKGYDTYFKGLLFYGNIPWVIMMIGDLSGLTQNIFEYLTPKAMNPIVLIFHFSIISLWILCARWIYFKKGAEFFESHPGLVQKKGFGGNANLTAKEVRLFFSLILVGNMVGMMIMWLMG